MSKPVLGRGLDRLMQSPPAEQPAGGTENAPVAPGLRILIRGNERVAETAPVAAQDSATVHRVPVCVILLLADAALLAWPAAWVWTHETASAGSMLACAGSVVLGAIAGISAARLWWRA